MESPFCSVAHYFACVAFTELTFSVSTNSFGLCMPVVDDAVVPLVYCAPSAVMTGTVLQLGNSQRQLGLTHSMSSSILVTFEHWLHHNISHTANIAFIGRALLQ